MKDEMERIGERESESRSTVRPRVRSIDRIVFIKKKKFQKKIFA